MFGSCLEQMELSLVISKNQFDNLENTRKSAGAVLRKHCVGVGECHRWLCFYDYISLYLIFWAAIGFYITSRKSCRSNLKVIQGLRGMAGLILSNWCKCMTKNATCSVLESKCRLKNKTKHFLVQNCWAIKFLFTLSVLIHGQTECPHSSFDRNTLSNHID